MVKYNTIFYKTGVIFHASVHGRRKDFSRGATNGFFQTFFLGGEQKWWSLLFTTRNQENTLFCWNFQIPAPFRHPCLYIGKSSCHTINSPVATPAHGLLRLSPSLRLRFIPENATLLCIFAHFPRLLTRALFFGPCHCSYVFVLCLASRIHVAGDLNKTISFVVGVLSTSFARALLGLIHSSPSCPMQSRTFLIRIHIGQSVFEAVDLYRTLDWKTNPMDSSHFENIFKRTTNCPVTRANMNELSKQRTNWGYHCSVTFVTQQSTSYHENFSLIVM